MSHSRHYKVTFDPSRVNIDAVRIYIQKHGDVPKYTEVVIPVNPDGSSNAQATAQSIQRFVPSFDFAAELLKHPYYSDAQRDTYIRDLFLTVWEHILDVFFCILNKPDVHGHASLTVTSQGTVLEITKT